MAMDESLSLGRIAGIRVGVNWSVLVVYWLIAISLADDLPREVGGLSAGAAWALGMLAATLFFASLLAHELGHAIVARRLGVSVEGITLWLFGGVSRLRGEAHTPGAEARIALAGPAVSLAVTMVFGAASAALAYTGPDGLLAIAIWLAAMNAILLVFNVMPAFPLDGGRVLHAALWRRRGDRLAATVSAARIGRAFGQVMVAVGIAEFFFVATLGGLWFVFLGWFLMSAARSEETTTLTRGALAGLRVRDVMTPDPVVAPGWITVAALLDDFLMRHHFTSFPVRDFEGAIVGIVTLAGLRTVAREARNATRVVDVATPLEAVPKATPGEPVIDLVERMHADRERRTLVFDGEKMVGIVSPADITRAIQVQSLRGGGVPRATPGGTP
jgi:Zn-dependent protease/CBS domain-containing protein